MLQVKGVRQKAGSAGQESFSEEEKEGQWKKFQAMWEEC